MVVSVISKRLCASKDWEDFCSCIKKCLFWNKVELDLCIYRPPERSHMFSRNTHTHAIGLYIAQHYSTSDTSGLSLSWRRGMWHCTADFVEHSRLSFQRFVLQVGIIKFFLNVLLCEVPKFFLHSVVRYNYRVSCTTTTRGGSREQILYGRGHE